MEVIIGIDPHKRSHTAVALDEHDQVLGELRVAAEQDQVARLLEFAAGWPQRIWAVENANGLGRLLARQLLAADQQAVDVPASLAARVRTLSGAGHKTDAHDARSIAIACRHAARLRTVADEVDGVLLGLLVERRHQIVSQRQKTLCRIHDQLMSLVAGGCSHHLTVKRISGELARIRPVDPPADRFDAVPELLSDTADRALRRAQLAAQREHHPHRLGPLLGRVPA